MKTFENKNIVLTGAGGGMGKAICEFLKSKGNNIFALDLYFKNGEIPENETFAVKDGVTYIICDVTETESVENAKNIILKKTEKINAIVHTAGIYDMDSLIEIDEKRFTKIFDINLFGVYRINKAFVPMLDEKSRVVMVSSELAPLDPLPFTGLYGITKSSLEKYAYSLRMELNLLGHKVSVIRPGAVKTNLLGDSSASLDRFCSNTKIYTCNAANFKKIVNSVETKNVTPDKIAKKVFSALSSAHPKYIYNINRNFLLKLLNILPRHLQVAIIKQILKTK